MKNYQHTRTPCPQCRNNTHTVYDSFHNETFCKTCGLVISDNHIITQVDLIIQEENKIKTIRNLWRHKIHKGEEKTINSSSAQLRNLK